MSLLDFAKQRIKPTVDQEKAFLAMDDFLKSNQKCFLLKGYAGTGKTTITKTIAEYVHHKKYQPILLAPTGRAARILSDKTGFDAHTIHRGIYNLKQLDEIEMNADGNKQYKFRFNLLEKKSNVTQIFLIDEASMISDKRSESDFFVFGSGVVLKDLIEFIGFANKERHDKVIFIGDPAQLPPVSDSISGALSKDYLKEKYDLEIAEFELTQVVRQAQESGILKVAAFLRNRLKPEGRTANFTIDTTHEDIDFLKAEEIVDLYEELNPKLKVNQTVIVNHSNKSALDYNLAIRDTFFKNSIGVQKGDLLMLHQNNYNFDTPLYNGTMVKVIHASPNPIVRSNMPSYDQNGKRCKVNLKFREVTIAVPISKGLQEITCLISDDFLYSEFPQMKYEEQIALYIDFKIRYPDLKPKTTAFKEALTTDPIFNALRVKYGYAITCHKAQGGEWEHVMVNLDLKIGKYSEAFNRWLYTAITRASKKLYLFNYQPITHFSKLNFTCTYLTEEATDGNKALAISFQLPQDLEELYKQFDLSDQEYFKREKFKDLLARAYHFGYSIKERKAHSFQEQYTFEKAEQRSTLIFWYNGKQLFTRTTILNNPNQDQEYSQQVLKDFNCPLQIIFEEEVAQPKPKSFEQLERNKNVIFPAEYKELKLLYDSLLKLIDEKEIRIENVVHKQFHELYYFVRQEENAVVQFYYNKNKQFTEAINLKKECNSNALLKDLERAIGKLNTIK